MENNDVLRRLRYALQLDDAEAARLAGLAGVQSSAEAMSRFRLRSEDGRAVACPDEALGAMLTGLVLDRRGPAQAEMTGTENGAPGGTSEADVASERLACDNNTVLKRIKTALSMRSEDVAACIRAGGGEVSAGVVSSFLRRPGARNFRGLGDQVLRRFLSGLATVQRVDPELPHE